MAEITIFDYSDYRDYLEATLKSDAFGRGGKAKLAKHLNCQPSFVSQVLKSKSSFTLEQAFKINSLFKHNHLEREFFMVLVEVDRAGTQDLKKYFIGKKNELIEKSKLVENQMSYEQLSDADAISYYNNWNHILIRNLIDIPEFKSLPVLKKKLGVSAEDFKLAFDFLVEKGMVLVNHEGMLEQGHTRLHIKKESPLAKYANITTRMQIIKNYDKSGYNSLNYCCNMTLPKTNFDEFKKRLTALIVELNTQLEKESDAEIMATFVVDLMEM